MADNFRTDILEEAIELINGDRNNDYGDPLDDFSTTATDAEIAGFVRAVGHVAREMGLVETGYRLLANIGIDAHQEVPHLHVHIFGGKPLGPMLIR